jgi:hypothetical protein
MPGVGYKHSEETKQKIRLANTGKANGMFGKRHSEERKKQMRDCFCGSRNPAWKGGTTLKNWGLRKKLQGLKKYQYWKQNVYEKDNYTCNLCDKRGGDLNAHHKKSFQTIIDNNKIISVEEAMKCDELWDTNNGLTLCIPCHKKIHKDAVQFEEVTRAAE